MKWNRIRWLRVVTVSVPCIWFLYVFYTLSLISAPSSHPPRQDEVEEKQIHPQVPGVKSQEDKDSQKGIPKQLTVNVHDQFLRREISARMNSKLTHDKDVKMRLGSAREGVVARMAMHDRGGGGGGEGGEGRGRGRRGGGGNQAMDHRGGFVPMKGRGEVNGDVTKGVDVVYTDVTFPPYVERLPSGASGQGPKGVRISVETLPEQQQREYREKWDKNQFNQYASDLIPVHRELPDYRDDRCRSQQYPVHLLPVMSVVMVFHNEAWSVLLRSVHSILDRTAPQLLREVVLVDDFSDMDHLKRPLEKYFLHQPRVKIVRMAKRGGLIQARLRGFEASTGEVVVFLDSHIECTQGWAEPMLQLVAQDYRTVPFPVIDIIHEDTLGYIKLSTSPFGVFSMSTLTFSWSYKLKRSPDPITGAKPSPTMPGGLFAISRKWFQELGAFDPDLEYWGGENMELSFKIWMCGGSIVIADCSHIGHIFRSQNPITWSRSLGNYNYVRVAMVWMDKYKNHYFERINYRVGDYGDVSARQALRASLKCHSFEWYIHNIYPELQDQLVFNATFAGQVRHEESGLCLDRLTREQIFKAPQLMVCHRQGGNQFWYLRDDRYLQSDTTYLGRKKTIPGTVALCLDASLAEEWAYSLTTRQLRHVATGQCLQSRSQTRGHRDVMLAPCRPYATGQKWSLDRRKPFKYR